MKATAITNVRVFNGTGLTDPQTVFIKDGRISVASPCETMIDGTGCTLLPGLIDSHIHLSGLEDLKQAAHFGVTTMMDMTTPSPTLVDSLRNLPGLPDIRSCYLAACSADSLLIKALGYPKESIVDSAADARRFVDSQIALRADYIKVILEDPAQSPGALTLPIVAALVEAAHQKSKLVFAHATTPATYRLAIQAGVDVLNHIPYSAELPQELIDALIEKNILVIPTMIMQQGIVAAVKQIHPHAPVDFGHVITSTRRLIASGATLIAGTDSNRNIDNGHVAHGSSMHTELALMVDAGITPVAALRSATSLPARTFGFHDRGSIAVGQRADLLLIKGDPTADISATQNIQAVFIAGIQVDRSEGVSYAL